MFSTNHLTNSQLDEYKEQGFVIVKGLLDSGAVPKLRDNVLTVLSARNMDDSFLAQTSEYLADSPIDDFVNHLDLRAVASSVLGGQAHMYLPFTAVKGPQQGAFKFHQDNQYTQLDGPACNCWFALSRTSVANGCLRIVAKSHLSGTLDSKKMFDEGAHLTVTEEPDSWVDIELEPGDCVIFNRLTVHGSGANTTNDVRVGYAVQFFREDVSWYNRDDDCWNLLTEVPRFRTGPVEVFSQQESE